MPVPPVRRGAEDEMDEEVGVELVLLLVVLLLVGEVCMLDFCSDEVGFSFLLQGRMFSTLLNNPMLSGMA